MIFHLPNGLMGYYVCDFKGTRLDEAPRVSSPTSLPKTKPSAMGCRASAATNGGQGFSRRCPPRGRGLTGGGKIDKREVLAQYPPHNDMKTLVEQDRLKFMRAMEQVLGREQTVEPLIGVTQRFIDAPLQVATVAGELGLVEANDLKTIFRQPNFASFGSWPRQQRGHPPRHVGRLLRPHCPGDGPRRAGDSDRRQQPSGLLALGHSPLDVVISTDKKKQCLCPGRRTRDLCRKPRPRQRVCRTRRHGHQGGKDHSRPRWQQG